MTSKELVKLTMKGKNPGKTPVYGWVSANLNKEISDNFGSVANFEDHYKFDMAHIFGGPSNYGVELENAKKSGVEITPELLLEIPLNSPNNMDDYKNIINSFAHHNERDRFCYIQTPGIFECLNGAFGIENHLMYLALYPDELKEVYKKQAEWNIQFAENMIELGADGIHISDDWGSQNNLMFSLEMFRELIYPYHKIMANEIKKHDILLSLHCDGCAVPALDSIVDIGYDFIHPWQENANMPYSLYLDKYKDKFGILGGLCIQSTLGFNNLERVESEIKRVFGLLKGERWAFCTTHFVQNHCSIDELVFAYDLALKLANDK